MLKYRVSKVKDKQHKSIEDKNFDNLKDAEDYGKAHLSMTTIIFM